MPLIRHRSLTALSRDHHHGLILAQLIKKNAPAYRELPSTIEGKAEYTVRFYNSELANHFHEEEEVLIPFIIGRNNELDDLLSEIFAEHKQIKILVDLIEKKFNLADNLNELGELLSLHIRKEERILFPKIQEVFTSEELDALGELLARQGR